MNPDNLRAAIEKIGIEKPSDYTLVLEEVGRMEAEEKLRLVKPIEWKDKAGEGWAIRWYGYAGSDHLYVAKAAAEGDMVLCDGRYYPTLELAKEGAQDDHEEKVRSLLKEGVTTLITASEAFIREAEEMGWGKTSDTQLPGSFDALKLATEKLR